MQEVLFVSSVLIFLNSILNVNFLLTFTAWYYLLFIKSVFIHITSSKARATLWFSKHSEVICFKIHLVRLSLWTPLGKGHRFLQLYWLLVQADILSATSQRAAEQCKLQEATLTGGSLTSGFLWISFTAVLYVSVKSLTNWLWLYEYPIRVVDNGAK
jgi:hypothetical protein